MPSPVIIGVVVVYLLFLLVIGVWGGKESHDVKGYYAAGKKLPSWVLAFSSNATGESAWLLLGLTGIGYALGMHALWVVLGEVLGVALAWAFVARPFKAFTDRYGSITVPDYLEDRFRDKTHSFRIVGAVIVLSMVAFYVGAQLTATGKAFDSFLGTGYGVGVGLGLAVVLFYTVVGGFKAVAYSDFAQGVLMFACLLVLPFVGIGAVGGWGALMDGLRAAAPLAVFEGLQASGPDLLRLGGGLGVTPLGIASAAGFVGVGLAFLGAPQLLARFLAARDQREIRKAGPIAVGCIIVFDMGAVFTGMAARVLFPALADPVDRPPRHGRGTPARPVHGARPRRRPRRHHVDRRFAAHPRLLRGGAGRLSEDLPPRCPAAGALRAGQGGDGRARRDRPAARAHRRAGDLLVRALRLVRPRGGVRPGRAVLALLGPNHARGRARRHDRRLPRHDAVGRPLQGGLLRPVRDASGLRGGLRRHDRRQPVHPAARGRGRGTGRNPRGDTLVVDAKDVVHRIDE
ncbi:MAG: hypothetical protein F4164_03830 [Gemmatimonadales bacterium]|nr:hypothetical protein [Gemmatimonadales bacterium]